MAEQIASSETGTTDKKDIGSFNAVLLYVEFVSSGDVDVQATPDDGSTWITYHNITESDLVTLSKSPEQIRLKANNGAEFNAWIE
jgi:hypothetical protein